jgi:hypothetical protein
MVSHWALQSERYRFDSGPGLSINFLGAGESSGVKGTVPAKYGSCLR